MVRQCAAKKTLPGVRASRANGGRASSVKSSEAPGQRLQRSATAIGDSARRPGEARPLPWSRCPAGTGKRCRMRGGFAGLRPEALCGEAPKGQPVIRREHLVTVGVEDPKGHPMIHGCRRHHSPRPCGRPMKRRDQSGPPSSRWTKAAKKKRGGLSPEPLHGKRGASRKSPKETQRSSSRRAARKRR